MKTNERNGGATGGDAERDPRLDRLYREVPCEEPPARLDAAILAAAHREAGARPRAASARLHAWRVPVSVAAVVMLSVSVVTLVREEGGDKLDSSTTMDSRTAPAQQAASEAAKAPDRARPAQPAPDAIGAQEQAKPASPAAREDAAPSNTAAAKAAEETAQRSAAASALFSEEAARRSTGSVAGLSSVAPEARAPVPAPAPPAPQPFRETPAMRGSSGETESSAVAGESKAQAEPTERMAPRDRATTGNTTGSSSMDHSLAAPAAVAKPEAVQRPAPPMLAKRAQAGPGPIARLIKELDLQPAEKWLEKIEALRREERRGEADGLLAEFKRRFPDYPLPPALR
jgi:hypothetical protein